MRHLRHIFQLQTHHHQPHTRRSFETCGENVPVFIVFEKILYRFGSLHSQTEPRNCVQIRVPSVRTKISISVQTQNPYDHAYEGEELLL